MLIMKSMGASLSASAVWRVGYPFVRTTCDRTHPRLSRCATGSSRRVELFAARLAERLVLADGTLPPQTLVPGHSPSHEHKRITLAKHLKSGPISARSFITVVTPIPSTQIRSMSVQFAIACRKANAGLFLKHRLGVPQSGASCQRFQPGPIDRRVCCAVQYFTGQAELVTFPLVGKETRKDERSCEEIGAGID